MIEDPVLQNDWHPVAAAAEVSGDRPTAVTLLDQSIVLWRSNSGVHAWMDLCVHRGARLSGGCVRGDRLVCPYHGWTYGPDGRCLAMPAHPNLKPPVRAQCQRFRAEERHGLVWVCLGETPGEIPAFPELEQPGFRRILCGPYRVRANGPRVIENFLDVAHFPFVHEGLLGAADHPEIPDYEAEVTPEGVIARDIRLWQPNPEGSGSGSEVSYTYKALRPLTAFFRKEQGARVYSMMNAVQPVTEGECIARIVLALNYSPESSEEDLRSFQDQIMSQDVPIVESQRPELLPLDLQSELHLRSDRTAIAYRKWLKVLGVRYGTA